MNLEDLMAGIGVVIDDAFDEPRREPNREDGAADPIFEIVEQIEREWNLPLYTAGSLPPEETWPGLLQSASFILLDWRLWPGGASELERAGIKKNLQFLNAAKDCFVPVFIFTNESAEDVTSRLPASVYPQESPDKSFVFVRNKTSLLSNGSLDFGDIEQWVRRNASVYALKTWDRVFRAARKELFGSMYERSPDWPRVFWKAYEDDGVDPSSSLTHLINENVRGRMQTSAFEAEVLAGPAAKVPTDDLQTLIGATSFRPGQALPDDEVGCGDVFRQSKGRFLLNLRPDCDCVARDKQTTDGVELYCIEGKRMGETQLRTQYQDGHFTERVWETVAFWVHDGNSVRFDFRKLRIERFSTLKEQRIGRLLHPYLTRIQQRFGLYLQRQGLPRVPEEAIPAEPPRPTETEP